MAASLIAGLIADGYAPTACGWPSPTPCAARAAGALRGAGGGGQREALAHAETLVLCVKPQLAPAVCRELGDLAAGLGLLVISVMAGVPEAGIQRWLGAPCRWCAPCPTPRPWCRPGPSACTQAPRSPRRAQPGRDHPARRRAHPLGRARRRRSTRSRPSRAAARLLLPADGGDGAGRYRPRPGSGDARLAHHPDRLGAARMAVESDSPPARLREQVTSPGGTTERALAVLEDGGLAAPGRPRPARRDRAVEISRTLLEQP
jgi:pyrroline-5-carboxylate reductase